MLEADGVLKTWALCLPPEAAPEQPAEKLPDHRLAYLDFEGELSGGRGQVRRHDRGDFEQIDRSENEWVVRLSGGRAMQGRVTLRAESATESQTGQRWMFSFGRGSAEATGLNSGCQTGELSDPPRVVRPAT